MTSITTPAVTGSGAASAALSSEELRATLEEALGDITAGERVLAIIADKTRDDNTDLLFPFAAQILASRGVAQFDALVAQGTHPPMTEEEKRLKIGADRSTVPGLGEVFDHQWDRAEELVTIGELSFERIRELTGGLIDRAVPLQVNRRLAPGLYDSVLIFGAVVPHEVAGFAGGAKYFFPGVGGPELTHMTHWVGALTTIEKVIGRVETPARHMIEAAADYVS